MNNIKIQMALSVVYVWNHIYNNNNNNNNMKYNFEFKEDREAILPF